MAAEKSIIEARFWSKVSKAGADECWLWTGLTNKKGYGRFVVTHNEIALAHRFSWYLLNGPIEEGVCILHHCDNPPCVNPSHLWEGTKAENNADMDRKGRRVNTPHYGEEHGRAKLTKEQVIEIRNTKGVTQTALGLRFGVSQSLIGQIQKRQLWAHIP